MSGFPATPLSLFCRKNLVTAFEKLPNSLPLNLFIISFVSVARVLLEWLVLDGRTPINVGFLLHNLGFYLAVFILNTSAMSLLLNRNWQKNFGIVGLGIFLGLLPMCLDAFNPLIDQQRYVYFDSFSLLFTSEILCVGETVTLWLWIVSFAIYIFIISGDLLKGLMAFIAAYVMVQYVGWISATLHDSILAWSNLKIPHEHSWAIWWVLHVIGLAIAFNGKEFVNIFKRMQHTLIWGVLVVFGAKLIGFVNIMSVYRAFIMVLSFFFIMMVNDYYDKDTDRLNNRESCITQDTMLLALYCHFLVVLIAGELDQVFGLLAFLFFILGIAYNLPAIRLKRHFITGSLVEGTGAMICLMVGGTQFGLPMNQWFVPIVILFGIGFAIASNFKDYKDFNGDHQVNIVTLYVFLYRQKWSIKSTHYFICTFLATVLLVPCFWLYLLKVSPLVIGFSVVTALVPPFVMALTPSAKTAVSYGLWSIILHFVCLITFIPRLPLKI